MADNTADAGQPDAETVTSTDGTTIAFDRYVGAGTGTVILVGGAFSYRGFPKMVQLAETLAVQHGLTVINYIALLAPPAAEFLKASSMAVFDDPGRSRDD